MASFFEVKIEIKCERFLEPKMDSKWRRRVAPKGAQRGPKGAPKIDHFFDVFSKASVNIDGGYEVCAALVLSPAVPLRRGLK